jgi:hypothetical protein
VTGAARHGSPLEPAEEAVARLAAKVVEDLDALQQGPAALAPEEPLLWLHPTDLSEQGVMSLDRQAQSLAGLIEAVNSSQDRYFLQVGTLQDYLQGVSANGLMSVAGELRPRPAGAKSWEGLFSSRPDLAASAAAAERCLERLAEPLCALWLAPTSWPTEDLGLAWDQVVRNSDWRLNTPVPIGQPARGTGPFSYPTTERYAYAAKLAGDAARQALAAAASAVSRPGPLVVNPAPRPRSGLVQVRGTPTTELPWVQVVRGGRSLVWAEDVPGYGWAALRSLSRGSEEPDIAPVRSGPNDVAGPSLDNGLVHLSVSSAEGTYAINGHWGLGALVDSPLERPDGHLNGNRAEMDLLGRTGSEASGRVERPTSVQVEVVENGPLRGRLAVTRRYGWGSMEADVRTLLELRAGEPLVRVTVSFSNLRPGHQLSTVFPLAAHASRSLVNSPFATTERPSVPEASYPFRGFVCVGGLSALHDGLAEYAVVANGWALAITLLRSPRVPDGSTPYSEDRHGWEPWDPWESDEPGQGLFGAGPRARTWAAAAQLGHHVVRYALALGDPSAGPAGGLSPFELAEMAFVPLQVVQAQGVGQLPERGTHLAVTGAEISALRRVDGELELRAFNPTPGPVVVEVPGRRGALVDIQGETLATWEGSFALAPWSIATARIL